jgi:hypothetical protein
MDGLIVSFQGGLADAHRLPAYAASQSLYGISRSLLVVTNYLGEGERPRTAFKARRRVMVSLTRRKRA